MPYARHPAGSKSLKLLLLVLCLALVVPPQAALAQSSDGSSSGSSGGIMGSVSGIFSKIGNGIKNLFGGKKSGSATASGQASQGDFPGLLNQMAQSQQTVSDKQTALQALLNQKGASAKPNDATVQERLNDLAQASRNNEALYVAVLQARDQAKQQKVDLSQYQPQMDQITNTQNQLEQQWQDIQKFEKGIGAFKPPAAVMAQNATGAGGDVDWKDPQVQGFIDEWLSGCQLTSWGQYIAPGAVAVGPPDHGSMQRCEYVWSNLQDKTADSNITLGDYVRSRLAGKNINIVLSRHVNTLGPSHAAIASGSAEPPAQPSETASQAEPTQAASAQSTDSSQGSDLQNLKDQEKSILASIQQLNAAGQGNSDQARALYQSLKAVQTQKNGLIQSQVSGGSLAPNSINPASTGEITTPR